MILKPIGNEGEIDHVGNVPDTVGICSLKTSSVKETVDGLYKIEAITAAAEDKLMTAVSDPDAFVAVTVKGALVKSDAGVPVISPVEVEKDNPLGKEGLMLHVAARPPIFDGFNDRIATLVANCSELGVYEISGAGNDQVIEPEAVIPFETKEKLSTPMTEPVKQKYAIPLESEVSLVDEDPETPEMVASTRTPKTGLPLASDT